MNIPQLSIKLIEMLDDIYPDVMELDPTFVNTPEYWKKAGIIELIKNLKQANKSSEV